MGISQSTHGTDNTLTLANLALMTAEGLGIKQLSSGDIISVSTPDEANRAIGVLDEALKVVNRQRADLGAYQNRMEHTMKGLAVGAENMQAAESRIRDADMAAEVVEFTKNSILLQASMAMLAQANLKPQTILQLLG